MSSRLTDGVFGCRASPAIEKPQGITSAQVLRNLQDQFIPSNHFAATLAAERERRIAESNRQQRRRKDKTVRVKLGHGGTLDPLATGILICGVGNGTKDLPSFLGCKKTYETVVLFGAATDTYDCLGKIVAQAPYQHITRKAAEAAIKEKFLGNIKQTPPIFSAKRIDGKHAYEYAREGKELPRELADKDMTVDECMILDWYEPGQHQFQWPTEEAPVEEKEAVKQVYGKVAEVEAQAEATEPGRKRATSAVEDQPEESAAKRQRQSSQEAEPATETRQSAEADPSTSTTKSGPAAAKIRLTVSSGFYVRSFCHDLGLALNSFGLMSALVRSRQADFNLSDEGSIMRYADIEKGEEVWSPKLTGLLKQWPSIRERMVAEKALIEGQDEDSDGSGAERRSRGGRHDQKRSKWSSSRRSDWKSKSQQVERRRQNTSSPEP